jgi:hydrogenase maturation factor HypE
MENSFSVKDLENQSRRFVEILSQNEIDDLLKAIKAETDDPADPSDADEYKSYTKASKLADIIAGSKGDPRNIKFDFSELEKIKPILGTEMTQNFEYMQHFMNSFFYNIADKIDSMFVKIDSLDSRIQRIEKVLRGGGDLLED